MPTPRGWLAAPGAAFVCPAKPSGSGLPGDLRRASSHGASPSTPSSRTRRRRVSSTLRRSGHSSAASLHSVSPTWPATSRSTWRTTTRPIPAAHTFPITSRRFTARTGSHVVAALPAGAIWHAREGGTARTRARRRMPWVFASPKPFDGTHPHRGDMAHLLIIELPGGDDTDLLIAAITRGDEFTFLSAQLDHYRNQPAVWSLLEAARELIDVPGFDDIEVMRRVLDVHACRRIDAVLCLLDIRLVEAARLAEKLNVRHISPATARLLRDKVSVRSRLAERGIAQPAFELAESNAQLQAAVQRLGLPVLIKPADGYGSQNIVVLRHAQDLDPLLTPLTQMLPSRADYGLGVVANDRLLVERYLSGTFFGCDTLSVDGRHTIVGLHQKVMFEPPSFAMRGSTFVPHSMPNANASMIERYVVSLLDAVGFNWGAAHTELMLTVEGLHVIEINPRLVGAKIARLVSHSLC